MTPFETGAEEKAGGAGPLLSVCCAAQRSGRCVLQGDTPEQTAIWNPRQKAFQAGEWKGVGSHGRAELRLSGTAPGRRLDGSGRPTELRFGAIHLSPLTFSLVPLSADPAGTFDERGRYRSRAGGAGEDAERWRFVCLSAVRTLAKEPLVSKGKAWCAQPWHMEHLDTHPSVHLLLKCLI